MKGRTSIIMTGCIYVIGALADVFPSRALGRRVSAGDVKLWCHMRRSTGSGYSVAAGRFRAAVFDGGNWRTFKLNFVADEDAYYSGFSDREHKARRCFAALAKLKGQTAYWREGTYGIVSTIKAEPPPCVEQHQAAKVSQPPPIGLNSATGAGQPPSGTASGGTKRRGRKQRFNPDQLTLF